MSRFAPFVVVAFLLFVAGGLPAEEAGETSRSGLQDTPQFGGPGSVGGQIREDDEERKPALRIEGIDRALEPWFEVKAFAAERMGFAYGLDYTAVIQGATSSPGEQGAAGGIFRFFFNWTLVGRESGNTGSWVFKVENRHNIGFPLAPQALGFEIGYLGITAGPYGDFGWGVTNFYWHQKFLKGRLAFVAGVVDPTDYVDLYGLTNPWTHFTNLVFLTDPTIPVPNQGLGLAIGGAPTDNLYILGGFADANGDATKAGFDTFFQDHEYFYHLEIGWTSDWERRYLDNVHVTGWYAAERAGAGVPSGWGLAFSAAYFIADKWMPFLRAGYSDGGGALLEGSVSAGFGYYFTESRDLVGFGFNWGRPPDPSLRDQYTVEIFYRFQLARNLAFTPDIQVLVHPANNPGAAVIGVFGLRGRLSL